MRNPESLAAVYIYIYIYIVGFGKLKSYKYSKGTMLFRRI